MEVVVVVVVAAAAAVVAVVVVVVAVISVAMLIVTGIETAIVGARGRVSATVIHVETATRIAIAIRHISSSNRLIEVVSVVVIVIVFVDVVVLAQEILAVIQHINCISQ